MFVLTLPAKWIPTNQPIKSDLQVHVIREEEINKKSRLVSVWMQTEFTTPLPSTEPQLFACSVRWRHVFGLVDNNGQRGQQLPLFTAHHVLERKC